MDTSEKLLSRTVSTLSVYLYFPLIGTNQDRLIFTSLYSLYNCFQPNQMCSKELCEQRLGPACWCALKKGKCAFFMLEETLLTFSKIVQLIITMIEHSTLFASLCRRRRRNHGSVVTGGDFVRIVAWSEFYISWPNTLNSIIMSLVASLQAIGYSHFL